MTVITIAKRGLPKLTTSTSSTTIASSSSTITSVASSSSSLPLLSNSTSSSIIPSITPPSRNGNPYILDSGDMPNGTVFIVVGGIAGVIFLAILLWWVITTYSSHRLTRSVQDYESKMFSTQHTQFYGDSPYMDYPAKENFQDQVHISESDISPGNKDESVKDALVSHTNNEKPFLSNFERPLFSLVSESNRNSLFISPTGDILYKTRLSKLYQESPRLLQKPVIMTSDNVSTNSLVSTISSSSASSLDNGNEKEVGEDIRKPAKIASSPSRKLLNSPESDGSVNRNHSKGNLLVVQSKRKPTPSTYLEHMLEGKEQDE
ncbi:BBT_HP_G0011360.mRNA.1.CDS.1 [Saccharomyces cerevisiae]|nr:BBT_HP_G0052970.mRNA.1.CDS.1 [Saccharomyces cerevisiae]CAI4990179.1 BBT_HP_G0071620.mRNA.1.CDS.1 [Saccharomyces cerevisiae]CAI5206771.1 BBT_HP_G0011360.mRNA.1.CDS.1 [Saccharomyces cerevisiae]CAI6688671.1 BBT_HP_G0052970.mRNA.1.CDS.1 [Saccharomyces cerevisiae]CAI6856280.1 BBT_HP_G0071620.mRNA.1.CDS.1 [Saccharomyces cerevisiae]